MIFFPKTGPWHMAQFRKQVVAVVTMPLVFSSAFWTTWAAVMYPEGNKE